MSLLLMDLLLLKCKLTMVYLWTSSGSLSALPISLMLKSNLGNSSVETTKVTSAFTPSELILLGT